MCGLIGIYDPDKSIKSSRELIEQGCQLMHHRGPDGSKIWQSQSLSLGFNRLSIIDIENSSQPLQWGPANESGRYTLVFNGEIYNYIELKEKLQTEFYL